MTKLISVMTPCYNEEAVIETLYGAVRDVFADLPEYDYEHIFIDNASTDSTAADTAPARRSGSRASR